MSRDSQRFQISAMMKPRMAGTTQKRAVSEGANHEGSVNCTGNSKRLRSTVEDGVSKKGESTF